MQTPLTYVVTYIVIFFYYALAIGEIVKFMDRKKNRSAKYTLSHHPPNDESG